MTFAFFRSITPSASTRAAVENNGGVFLRPTSHLRLSDYDFGWNWGNAQFALETHPDTPLWNPPSAISFLQSPAQTEQVLEGLTPRAMLDDHGEFDSHIPGEPHLYYSWWAKGPGHGSQNKVQFLTMGTQAPVTSRLPEFDEWAIQPHVGGTHYRLITVGHRLVQCHLRTGHSHRRDYEWIRMREVPTESKDIAREAARRLSDLRTIIGWDIVQSHIGTAYVLEGNAAPGLNDATVERIVREVRRQEEEHAQR